MAHQIKNEIAEIVKNYETSVQQERTKALAVSLRTVWML